MNTINTIAMILVLVGALNWGLVGGFGLDLVQWLNDQLFKKSDTFARVIYVLVGLSAVYLIFRKLSHKSARVPVAAPQKPVDQKAEGYGCGCQ